MATSPDWLPPEKTRPITPEVYALLRTYIEAGCAATRQFVANRKAGCDNLGGVFDETSKQTCRTVKTNPSTSDMAVLFCEFVPLDSLSLAAALELREVMGYAPDHVFEIWELPGWPFWVDRDMLIDALDAATPADVKSSMKLDQPPDEAGKLTELPNAREGGLEWWTIALGVTAGVVGVLAFLGRRTLVGFAVSLVPRGVLASIARGLFQLLVAAGIIAAVTYLGKKAAEHAAGAASALLPLVLIGGAVVVGIGIYYATRRTGGRREAA